MHFVAFHLFGLHGAKRTSSNVQGDTEALDSARIEGFQNARCEVQTSCWCSHAPFHTTIYGLVGFQVALLRCAVEVRRNRQFAYRFKDFRERQRMIVPTQCDGMSAANGFAPLCGEMNGVACHVNVS